MRRRGDRHGGRPRLHSGEVLALPVTRDFVVALFAGVIWFLQSCRRHLRAAADGVLQAEELTQLSERNGWAMMFAIVAAAGMAGFAAVDNFVKTTYAPRKRSMASRKIRYRFVAI